MRLAFRKARRPPLASQRINASLYGLILWGVAVSALELDLNSDASIRQAASSAAYGMVSWYTGNNTGDVPGNLPAPYYWWECGAMFMSLIDYWFYTGDSSYNELVTQGMLWQAGPDADYMPLNQTSSLGNDDQAFWAFAALEAAELKYPNPPSDQPQWLALAQAVFNTQAVRWDKGTCGGGLRWQVFTFNNGYDYKNAISNGCFFHLAARLGRYTGNMTYTNWAERAWDWSTNIGLITPEFQVLDGTGVVDNCTEMNHLSWSYNAGVYLYGAANMWDLTKDQIWRDRVNSLLAGLSIFFQEDIMWESACEAALNCNVDQRSFKAYLSRWMAATTQLAPWTYDLIMPKLAASAQAAALQCSGGTNGETCGMSWTRGAEYDGTTGVGEQMAAMSIFGANLIRKVNVPVTDSTGGNSKGDPSAGTNVDTTAYDFLNRKITTADRVGAGMLTSISFILTISGAYFIMT